MKISEEGIAALKKENEAKENTSQEVQIKEKIAELKKKLAEIKSNPNQEKKVNAIEQQISILSMQLIQLQKLNSESSSV